MIGVPARLFQSGPGMALQQTGSGSIISVRYWDLVFEFEIATVSIGASPLVFLVSAGTLMMLGLVQARS